MVDYKYNFDVIFEKVVNPLINQMKSDYNLHSFTFFSKIIIKYVFIKEANIFVKSYMVDNTLEIDKHKLAACLMKAIASVKPLKIPVWEKVKILFSKADYPKEYFLANQYLALSVAITILESYIHSDKNKTLKHDIVFPEPFIDGQKDYIRDVCLDLYYSKPSRINVVTYANVFFLLEKYSCRKIQCDNLEANYIDHLCSAGMTEAQAREFVKNVKFGVTKNN